MNDELLIPQTSPSLLLRIRDTSDGASWRTFDEVYRPVILAWCRMKGAAPADAEDIAQEVMASVSRVIKSFEYTPERGRFRAWLGTITSNELKTHVARKQKRSLIDLPSDSSAEPTADPDSDWVTIYGKRIFEAACQRISDQFELATWQCFEATWLGRKPAADVAASLGLPIHSVYVNKSRVLKRLESEVLMLADEFLPFEPESSDE